MKEVGLILSLEEMKKRMTQLRIRKQKGKTTVFSHLDFKFIQKKMPKIGSINKTMIAKGHYYQTDINFK